MIVVDKNGLEGAIISPPSIDPSRVSNYSSQSARDHEVLVRFQNGQQLLVPWALLVHQADDRYSLPISVDELAATQSVQGHRAATHSAIASDQGDYLVIPVVDEELSVQKRVIETGVTEIRKTVHEHVERVDEPLRAEDVEIERVAVNRIVDAPLQIRHEGDTMIIPLLEEVLVVEKRLMLREEVHVKRVHREVHEPQDVLLQEERVEIVRKPAAGHDTGQGSEQAVPRQ